MLTPERRLELLEEILARPEARITTGLPANSLEPEEEQAERQMEAKQDAARDFLSKKTTCIIELSKKTPFN